MKHLAAVALLSAIAVSQTKPSPTASPTASPTEWQSKPRSAAFRASGLTAFDSIHSLSDNVETSEIGFQTRQVEAEKNLVVAEHHINTKEDKRQYEILYWWKELIDRQRKMFQAGETGEPRVHEMWLAAFTCGLEADFIFKPSNLSDEGKKTAKKAQCVENAKAIIEGGLH